MPYSHLLRQALPTEGDHDLSAWFYACEANDVYYDAASRRAMLRTHFCAEGMSVNGHYGCPIPGQIQTLGEMLQYLEKAEALALNPNPTLLQLSWPAQSKELTFAAKVLRVGRDPSNALTVSDAPWSRYLSRSHATFTCRQGTWFLTDFASSNGTWVSGQKLSPFAETALKPGDRIRFSSKSDDILFEPFTK